GIGAAVENGVAWRVNWSRIRLLWVTSVIAEPLLMAELRGDLTQKQAEAGGRHFMRHRPEPESTNDPADAELVERGKILGDARRRAVDQPVAAGGSRPRQVAVRHGDEPAGLGKDPVAHFRPGEGHRL